MKWKFSYLFYLFFMISYTAYPNLSLPSIFSNNMVLQRNAEVTIWGWAKPGQVISITTSWDNTPLKVKANTLAYWEILLPTPDLRGEQEITITGNKQIVLKNVLLGEVWLVSGQSNMEWSANDGIENAAEAIATATNNNLRFFTVSHRSATTVQQDVNGSWVSSTPQTMQTFSAVAYFFGKKLNQELEGIPIGIINSSWGGTPAEVWMAKEVIENNDTLKKAAALLPKQEWGPSTTGSLYNAMIAPLSAFKLAGILWYQGESNTPNATYYEQIFTSLITTWRKDWGEELPFLYAQIAPFNYGEGYSGVEIRDAQRKVLSLPKTGMVITSDIGDVNDIHPRNKLDVGLRFANLALAEVYGKPIKAHPPLFEKLEKQGNTLKVFFKNAEGLSIKKEPFGSQFEIAGEDGIYYSAKAQIKKEIIYLSSKEVSNPVHVRFAWGNMSTSNLFNAAGLPASSFKSN